MTDSTVEKILQTGVKKVKTDGVETEFVDPAELRKQARRGDSTSNQRRPVVSTINLSGS